MKGATECWASLTKLCEAYRGAQRKNTYFQGSRSRRLIVATGNENVCRTCGKTGAAPYDELRTALGEATARSPDAGTDAGKRNRGRDAEFARCRTESRRRAIVRSAQESGASRSA